MPEGDREWGSAQCSSLEHLEDFVRQFIGHAPTHMFVQTLLVLEAADARAAARDSSAGGALENPPHFAVLDFTIPAASLSGNLVGMALQHGGVDTACGPAANQTAAAHVSSDGERQRREPAVQVTIQKTAVRNTKCIREDVERPYRGHGP